MKIIACYSNKGGVGKTATSVNLAHAFAESGHKTLLCDLDAQGASSFYFRLKPSKKLEGDAFFTEEKALLKSIKASDFDNLDVIPANMSFKDFDVFLSSMKKPDSQLRKALKRVKKEYDVVVLDCPPTLSMLSQAVFECADRVVVPVIPTTLSERTIEQLYDFFKESGLNKDAILPFFSMVQKAKKLHTETIERLSETFPAFCTTMIPFSSDVERMGVNRAPLLAYGKQTTAAMHYKHLWQEVSASAGMPRS